MKMTKHGLIAALGEMERKCRPLCLCGHYEHCESCSSNSAFNKLVHEIRVLSDEIAAQDVGPSDETTLLP